MQRHLLATTEYLQQRLSQAVDLSDSPGPSSPFHPQQQSRLPSPESTSVFASRTSLVHLVINGQGQPERRPSTAYLDGMHESDPLLAPPFTTSLDSYDAKLGTWDGVFIPVVLSIWGILLYIRLGYFIAQAGLLVSLGMFCLGYLINFLTMLSQSAIATNGSVRGGGAYYLISRSMGAEVGGAIGIILYLGNILSIVMGILGAVEAFLYNCGIHQGVFTRWAPENGFYPFLYGTLLLVFCTLLCLVGARGFARTSLLLFIIMSASVVCMMATFLFREPLFLPDRQIEFTGWRTETLLHNLWPAYDAQVGFNTVFSILYPACTGILTGSGMSGDLRQPSKSIPIGTFWSVVMTFVTYVILSLFCAATTDRSTLRWNYNFIQEISLMPWLIVTGILATSLFSTLGTLLTCAKQLQAMAKDALLPRVFGNGGEVPLESIAISYLLCQLLLFIQHLDALSPFVTCTFLMSYGALNVACLVHEWAGAPNFRPMFRYYRWWTALLGAVLCLVAMFIVDVLFTLVSILCIVGLLLLLHYLAPAKPWGSISQALIYHQVRKYLLRLDQRKEHVKYWRPQILFLVSSPHRHFQLIQFLNALKKGGLYVLGHVRTTDAIVPFEVLAADHTQHLGEWLQLVDALQLKAFVEVTLSDSLLQGLRHLILNVGLGGMKANVVVMGMLESDSVYERRVHFKYLGKIMPHVLLPNTQSVPFTPVDYVKLMRNVLLLRKSLVLARHFHLMTLQGQFIDIWPIALSNPYFEACLESYAMVLQMGCILHMCDDWQSHLLRVRCFVEQETDVVLARKRLAALLLDLRIRVHSIDVFVLYSPALDSLSNQEQMQYINRLVLEKTQVTQTAVLFTTLPPPPEQDSEVETYLSGLDVLTKGWPPTLLMHASSLTVTTCL